MQHLNKHHWRLQLLPLALNTLTLHKQRDYCSLLDEQAVKDRYKE